MMMLMMMIMMMESIKLTGWKRITKMKTIIDAENGVGNGDLE